MKSSRQFIVVNMNDSTGSRPEIGDKADCHCPIVEQAAFLMKYLKCLLFAIFGTLTHAQDKPSPVGLEFTSAQAGATAFQSFCFKCHDAMSTDSELARLAPVALEKWTRVLNDTETKSPFAEWAKAWRAIPANVSDAKLRAMCLAIVSDKADAAASAIAENKGDFAPLYEISFHEAKEEVLAAAKDEGRWPFRIDIGDAKELFLVMTDAGDSAAGEYGLWHNGRFIFKDGTSKPW